MIRPGQTSSNGQTTDTYSDSEQEADSAVVESVSDLNLSEDDVEYNAQSMESTHDDAIVPDEYAADEPGERPNFTVDEDFVVVGVNSTLLTETVADIELDTTQTNMARRDTAHEDFVVVEPSKIPDLELPEVDILDYVDHWTTVVPNIAALIMHELWPQLRSYLESLPQFGDVNLVTVVNTVTEEVGADQAPAGGVGEESGTGFAFYATFFASSRWKQPITLRKEPAFAAWLHDSAITGILRLSTWTQLTKIYVVFTTKIGPNFSQSRFQCL